MLLPMTSLLLSVHKWMLNNETSCLSLSQVQHSVSEHRFWVGVPTGRPHPSFPIGMHRPWKRFGQGNMHKTIRTNTCPCAAAKSHIIAHQQGAISINFQVFLMRAMLVIADTSSTSFPPSNGTLVTWPCSNRDPIGNVARVRITKKPMGFWMTVPHQRCFGAEADTAFVKTSKASLWPWGPVSKFRRCCREELPANTFSQWPYNGKKKKGTPFKNIQKPQYQNLILGSVTYSEAETKTMFLHGNRLLRTSFFMREWSCNAICWRSVVANIIQNFQMPPSCTAIDPGCSLGYHLGNRVS